MAHSHHKKSTLTLPNNIQFLPLAIGFAKQNAAIRGFGKDAIQDIELAVEEAVSNVIQHAFAPEEEAEFSIISEYLPLGLKIIIKDKGMPFDPAHIPVYDPKAQQKEITPQGLGWHLMRQFMDEVTFNNLGKEGKELHLVKNFTQKQEDTLFENIKKEDNKAETGFPPKSVPFTVRKAKPSDAIEIAKCAYGVYGYTYEMEEVYHPDQLSTLLESGQFISFLAFTKGEKQEVMAHGGLNIISPEDKIAELAFFATRGKYQKQGCGKKIGAALIKQALLTGLNGLVGTATTVHTLSQRAAAANNLKECSILIGYVPASRYYKQFEAENHNRITMIFCYASLRLSSYLKLGLYKKTIYPPNHHRAIIEKIYSNLNEKPRLLSFDENAHSLSNEETELKIQTFPSKLSAKIEVKKYGIDAVQQICNLLKKLCVEGFEVIYLHLHLSNPLTARLTSNFEELGFFFVGIDPGSKSGDKLVLEYLNNILIDYNKILLHSPFAKELLAYIKERDPLQKVLNT